MKIGIVKETFHDETRVALVPASVKKFVKLGHLVFLQSNAGLAAGYPDSLYEQAGATILNDRQSIFKQSELITTIRAAGANPDEMQHDIAQLTDNHNRVRSRLCAPNQVIAPVHPVKCCELSPHKYPLVLSLQPLRPVLRT